jgi:hypothetical protein
MTQARLRGLEFDAYLNRVVELDPSQVKFVKDFKRTISRSVVEKPTVVYRSTNNELLLNTRVGETITEPAFVSTSKDKALTAERTSTIKMEIELPKGHPGLDIEASYAQFGARERNLEGAGYASTEKEVLLPPGTRFKIVSRDGNNVKVRALLPKKAPQVQASGGLQTIAADMRDGFRNSLAKGNRVELLNPQTGSWRSVDPDTISQKLLVEGQFRIVKPGNQGQVVTSKVYGTSVDLRTFAGSRVRLGLNDYPELKKLGIDARKPDSWKGKEKELLEWMRDNNVGKLTLPDTKANGRATVLVDPNMVETATQNPAATLARTRIETIRNTEALRANESRIMDILKATIQNKGGTFELQTGAVPQAGYSVAVRGATWQYQLDNAIADSPAARESLIQHIEDNLNKFEGADHFGTWLHLTTMVL